MSDGPDAGDETPDEEHEQVGDSEYDATDGSADEQRDVSDSSESEHDGDAPERDDEDAERGDPESDEVEGDAEPDGDDSGSESADTDESDPDDSDGDPDDSDGDSDDPDAPDSLDIADEQLASARVTVGEYDWEDFKEEFFYEDGSPPTNWRGKPYPFEPEEYLGYDPDEVGDRVETGAETAVGLSAYFEDFLDPEATPVALGDYLWEHFRYEYYYEDGEEGMVRPRDDGGEVVPFEAAEWLGHEDFPADFFEGATAGALASDGFEDWLDPETTPVTKGEYYWEHFKYEYYYTDTETTAPERPRDDDGEIDDFEKEEWLGFPEDDIEDLLAEGASDARKLLAVEDERTLDVPEDLDEDAFFSTVEGHTTLVNRYDLEKEVALPKKQHFREVDRYWVNKPYSFVVIFHSEKENETKYYLVEPYCTPIEEDLTEFLTGKLRASIKYSSDDVVVEAEEEERAEVIERETMRLLARYDLYAENDGERAEQLRELLERYDETKETVSEVVARARAEADEAVEPIREALAKRRDGPETPEDEGDETEADAEEDDAEDTEGDDPTEADSPSDAEGDVEEVVADGGAVGDDGPDSPETPDSSDGPASADGHGTEDRPDTEDGTDAPTRSEDGEDGKDGDSADLPATGDGASGDGDGGLVADDEESDSPIRLDEYVDLDFEAEGGLREQVRALVEAKIEALEPDESGGLDGISVRPEPALLAEDDDSLSEYQAEKLLYYLQRDFIGYERIDGIKHDINVEDISCDGYNSPVFVYHTDYEQVITNVYHGEDDLDDFVVKMAQRSGKGISKRQPQVDATLPDGSRAQLTLGREVSDHGTNYTIRQFKDVPFTPIDLVNWNTFSLEEMAFMWLAIENHKSLIFAGGTASGKTTSLNAVSLFIPSNTKIVSIEDTREVELPQRNWIASVTRPSFSDDDKGDVDEFDLLEAALRQRPDYIVMGEIRGEEGRTLFQVMSTGHTTYTTFHADTVGEVLKRFTTEPINVSKTLFTALDLVSIQTQTRVQGSKVRRNKSLTEINHYDPENDEINVQDIFQWRAEDDEFMRLSGSSTMEDIMFDRGWSRDRLEREILKRRVILAYLIKNGLNEYTQVAATVQAFINDPDTILTLVANGKLEESLEDLREMESVHIDIDPKKEEMVPRPDPDDQTYELAQGILAEAEDRLLDDYRGADADVDGLAVALADTDRPTGAPSEVEADADASPDSDPQSPFGEDVFDAENVEVESEPPGADESVRERYEGGELGRFPDRGEDEVDAGGGTGEGDDFAGDGPVGGAGDGDTAGDPGDDSADTAGDASDPVDDTAGDDADDAFGEFERAFDELDDGEDSDARDGGDRR